LNEQLKEGFEAKNQLEVKVMSLENENSELTEKINALMEDLSERLKAKDEEMASKVRLQS